MKLKPLTYYYLRQKVSGKIIIFLMLAILNLMFNDAWAQENEGRKIEGLTFQVQIKAIAGKRLDIRSLKEKYQIQDVKEYYHKGFYKYATGSFLKYEEAARYRDQLVNTYGLTDIFIIAVKDNQILDKWSRFDVGIASTSKTSTPKPASQEEKTGPAKATDERKPPAEKEINITTPEKSLNNQQPIALDDTTSEISKDTLTPVVDSGSKTSGAPSVSKEEIEEESAFSRMNNIYMNFLEDNISGSRIVYIAFTLALFFTLTIIVVIIILAISRTVKNVEAKVMHNLQVQYQNILMDYLFSEATHKTIPVTFLYLRSNFKREALVREILKLHDKMTGEIYEKLNYLYLQLALHTHSLKKLDSRKWHIVAQGMKELTQMDITPAAEKIFKLTKSRNKIIRIEAQVAYIMLNKTNPFEFLEQFEYHLSDWEKLNIHYLLTHHPIEIPDFSIWLSSPNQSVVIFCLQMIAIFKQYQAIEKVQDLLYHENQLIQLHAVKCLATLEYDECSSNLIEKYHQTNSPELKTEIIDAMSKFSKTSNVGFLEKVLAEANSFDMKFKVVHALKSYSGYGKIIIEKYARNDEEIKKIYQHLNDPRI